MRGARGLGTDSSALREPSFNRDPAAAQEKNKQSSNLNRLTKVEDAIATTTGVNDFKNTVNVATESTYTTAGDLNTDQNKGITGTTYNVLGKPRQITFNNNRRLDYFYDAAGNKTKMQVWTGSPLALTVTTDYVGGFVYENNNLSFFSSPEGRVVKNGANFEYQYAIADHQGNTRVLFSGAPPAAQSATANFEAATNANFQNYANRSAFALFNRTAGGTTSQLLNGGANGRVGLAKTYRIYAGDKVKIEAYGKYTNATTTASNLAGFATALLNAYSLPAPTGGETGTPSAALNTWGGLVAGGNGGSGTVKAFVNIIVFDKNHKLLDMMWDPIDASANQVGATPVVPHDYMMREYTAKEECIVYLYVSNESPTLVDVYFDDVAMTYTPSRVVQYNEYYPFQNTTQNSWTRANATKNNFLGNGGTELNATSNFYDLEYRHYDPVLGRMNGVDPMASKYSSLSPYNFSFNSPVMFNDPSGADPPQTVNGSATTSPYYIMYTYDDRIDPTGLGAQTICAQCWREGNAGAMAFYGAAMGITGSGGWQAQLMMSFANDIRNSGGGVGQFARMFGMNYGGGLNGLTRGLASLGLQLVPNTPPPPPIINWYGHDNLVASANGAMLVLPPPKRPDPVDIWDDDKTAVVNNLISHLHYIGHNPELNHNLTDIVKSFREPVPWWKAWMPGIGGGNSTSGRAKIFGAEAQWFVGVSGNPYNDKWRTSKANMNLSLQSHSHWAKSFIDGKEKKIYQIIVFNGDQENKLIFFNFENRDAWQKLLNFIRKK